MNLSAFFNTTPPPSGALPQRLTSVDVYRGFVMFLMMAEVLEFCNVASGHPTNGFWRTLCWHQSHVEWTGCSLHDMIQPSFSFLVGVALPFSIAARQSKGQAFSGMLQHTLWRSFVLIALGIFLRSMWSKQTYFTFEDTLTQIGLGYTFLFLLGFAPFKMQVLSVAALLVGYWLAFALYQTPAGWDAASVGVGADWSGHLLQGFAGHWNKNSNFAWAFDTWFLNLFPRETPFLFNSGGYATLSFIPTLATMVLGLFAGQILRQQQQPSEKIKKMALWGVVGMVLGLLIHWLGICPIVKRIWTPSWALFSGGACFLFLAAFYYLTDIKNIQRPFFWLMVIGANSIVAYLLAHTVTEFIHHSFQIHLGQQYDQVLGASYASLVRGGVMLLVQWWVLYAMWKRRIFIKI